MKSEIYELIKTIEFDIILDKDDSFNLRIELFQNTADPQIFRAHLWQTEFYRILPTFPQHKGQPIHDPSDEMFLIDWSHYLTQDYSSFQASSAEAAIQIILKDIEQFLLKVNNSEI